MHQSVTRPEGTAVVIDDDDMVGIVSSPREAFRVCWMRVGSCQA